MFCRDSRRRLTHLAIRLTRIAIRTALRDLLGAPGGGRTAEPAAERTRKRFCGSKAHRQRKIQNRQARLACQSHGGDLNAPAAQVVTQRFAHPRREQSMKVERGKVRDFGQGGQVEWLVQMPINVCHHPMHSTFVFATAVLQNHAAPGTCSRICRGRTPDRLALPDSIGSFTDATARCCIAVRCRHIPASAWSIGRYIPPSRGSSVRVPRDRHRTRQPTPTNPHLT